MVEIGQEGMVRTPLQARGSTFLKLTTGREYAGQSTTKELPRKPSLIWSQVGPKNSSHFLYKKQNKKTTTENPHGFPLEMGRELT